jgi:hypothetical protein
MPSREALGHGHAPGIPAFVVPGWSGAGVYRYTTSTDPCILNKLENERANMSVVSRSRAAVSAGDVP